jgi:alpha-N-arabinofuranosidase
MLKKLFKLLIFILLIADVQAQSVAHFDYFTYKGNDDFYKQHPLKDSESFYNPLHPGFYPDPSICRRGNDYFQVNSTFSYFPGLPIFHSKDLVNWRQIGNVINRPTQVSFAGLGTSAGLYAPAIEYNPHNKMFYLVCTNIGEGGNFVVKTDDPFKGKWSDPIWLKFNGIDPSIFFDKDGRGYIVNNGDPEVPSRYNGHKAAWLQEFDTKTDQMVGPRKVLRDGGFRPQDKPIWIEGPHVYLIKGKYYLMTAEGGTGDNHSEVIYRSDSLWGKYEPYAGNPILTQRTLSRGRTNPVSNTGHADIIDTPEGDWWSVFLGCRPFQYPYENLGRETFMMPVKWSADGFPILTQGNDTVPLIIRRKGVKRDPKILRGNFTVTDQFSSTKLGHEWLMLRTPLQLPYSLTATKGFLDLKCLPITSLERKTPAAVLRRIQHHKFEVVTSVSFQPKTEKEAAGIIIFRDEPYQYQLLISKKNAVTTLSLIKVIPQEVEKQKKAVSTVLATSAPLKNISALKLKVVSDGPTFSFYYSENNKWMQIGDKVDAKHLTTEVTGGFIGTTIGMYATGNFELK